jgi:hypothetical protein
MVNLFRVMKALTVVDGINGPFVARFGVNPKLHPDLIKYQERRNVKVAAGITCRSRIPPYCKHTGTG